MEFFHRLKVFYLRIPRHTEPRVIINWSARAHRYYVETSSMFNRCVYVPNRHKIRRILWERNIRERSLRRGEHKFFQNPSWLPSQIHSFLGEDLLDNRT